MSDQHPSPSRSNEYSQPQESPMAYMVYLERGEFDYFVYPTIEAARMGAAHADIDESEIVPLYRRDAFPIVASEIKPSMYPRAVGFMRRGEVQWESDRKPLDGAIVYAHKDTK